jgi:hypothetical protein
LDTNSPLSHTQERTLSDPVIDVVLAGHERHWLLALALYVVEKVLPGQLVHAEDLAAANVPALHAAHVMSLDAPCTGDAVPDGQSTHCALSEKVPVGQISTISSVLVIDWMYPCVRFACCSSGLRFWFRVVLPERVSMSTPMLICCMEGWARVKRRSAAMKLAFIRTQGGGGFNTWLGILLSKI